MDQVTWWRLWVMSGILTLFIAFACCLWIMRSARRELTGAVRQVEREYEKLNERMEVLSDRMASVEQQLLELILRLFPEHGE